MMAQRQGQAMTLSCVCGSLCAGEIEVLMWRGGGPTRPCSVGLEAGRRNRDRSKASFDHTGTYHTVLPCTQLMVGAYREVPSRQSQVSAATTRRSRPILLVGTSSYPTA